MDKGKAKLTAYEEEPDEYQSLEDDPKREFEFCVAEGIGQTSSHGSQHPKKSLNDIFLEPCGHGYEENDFLEAQVANNVMMAAYKEIMTIALKANTWVVGTPAVGSVEYFLEMFRSSPPSGFGTESSIERAVLPIEPRRLVSMIMDVDAWVFHLSHIVRRGSGDCSIDVNLRLADSSMENPNLVNAEFHLPTPFVPTRKYCFLRCQKQIIRNIWAIIDVSVNYFCGTPDSSSENKYWRKPSGVIIRGHGDHFQNSEVIWIENVEVHDCLAEGNIYSNIINSNLGFCAKRWVNILAQKLKRRQSRFINLLQERNPAAGFNMLCLAEEMEKVFLEYVNEAPNQSKWIVLSDEEARILMDITGNHVGKLDSNNYIAVTSFHVKAKPLSVFQYLRKKNMELQWGSLLYQDEAKGMMQLVSRDCSFSVELHKCMVPQDDLTERMIYFLQEVSEDEFCSLLLSSPLIESQVYAALFFGDFLHENNVNILLQPSGFAIMPDGSGGLQADASLVTIALRRQLEAPQGAEDFIIEAMNALITDTVEDIMEAVTGREDSMS